MKTLICIITAILLCTILWGCSVRKSYIMYSTDTINSINGSDSIEVIDLKEYDIYRREYYFLYTKDTLIKGYEGKKVNKKNIRYEMQFFLVEKKQSDLKRVMYVSMIPPHKDCHNWIYNYKIYDSLQVFNVGLINYVKFGILDKDNEVKFNNKGSVSKWKVSLKPESIAVEHVWFKEGWNKISANPSEILQHKPIYTKLDAPKIYLHYYQDRSESKEDTDYFKTNYLMYYNTKKHTLSIEFNDPLWEDDDQKKTWIQYRSNRVRAGLQ